MEILVVNAGSSSLKLRLLASDLAVRADADIDPWPADAAGPIEGFLADAGRVDATGHRVVHGGADAGGPVVLTAAVEERLDALGSLAPLHQPRAVAAVRTVQRLLPDVPHVACFDTTFHRTLPADAATYALPADWRARWGLRRFGFHGLSHAWVARRAPELAGLPPVGTRIVSCHLGSGSSLCAIRDGRSVDTTMGFTPLEGLVMGTRSGDVDPGLLVWLLQTGAVDVDALADGLEHRSGLAGLSGTTGDMREVLAARRAGREDAALAFAVFAHRLRAGIAAMAAALGGVDVVAFTGGIGEHVPEVRAAALDGLAFLGAELDGHANARTTGDGDISGARSTARAVVIGAREDLEIAHQVRGLLEAA
jgi:acetate kinase